MIGTELDATVNDDDATSEDEELKEVTDDVEAVSYTHLSSNNKRSG